MATNTEVENRRLKIKQLLGEGYGAGKIKTQLNIKKRTFQRDLQEIRNQIRESPEQDFAVNRILELRNNLLRKVFEKTKKAKSFEGELKAIQVANNILTDLIKDYERVGLIPTAKDSMKQDNEVSLLTQLKM